LVRPGAEALAMKAMPQNAGVTVVGTRRKRDVGKRDVELNRPDRTMRLPPQAVKIIMKR
jgi:hypothetical protein